MRAEHNDTVNCPSCGATLVAGLRFCRMCGYRLGEGVEEFVATQRFDASSMPTAAAAPPPSTDPFAARQTWGAAPMQPIQPFGATSALNQPQQAAGVAGWAKSGTTKRGGWWLWLTIAIVLLIAGGMVPLSMRRGGGGGRGGGAVAAKSFLGVDGFETAPGGGAFIQGIAGPETPIVRAGLIGGDVIKSFDRQLVEDAEVMRRILAETPVGKTVEVIFIRDGAEGKTLLTTTAQKDTPGLRLFDRRPGGRGVIGVDLGERVKVPNTNIYGVELDDVNRNEPAHMAGLKDGDIVIKFGEHPIRTTGDLRYRIAEAMPGDTVPVLVVRGAQQVEVPVKIGWSRD